MYNPLHVHFTASRACNLFSNCNQQVKIKLFFQVEKSLSALILELHVLFCLFCIAMSGYLLDAINVSGTTNLASPWTCQF